jgi:pimeloyl-ACP methyl ester carboxylesterase
MQKAAPTMRYVEVPGVGHAPMLDEPAAKSEIFEFLRDLP